MSYWQMDDCFMGHHKTRRAIRSGPNALVMWCALRTYVALHLTDGFIPDGEIDDLPDAPKNPRKWLAVLVACGRTLKEGGQGAGLVDPCDGGWMLHDYLDHAQSAEKIRKNRSDSAERKRRWREGRERQESPQESRPGTRSATRDQHVQRRVPDASPSHPIPIYTNLGSKDLTGTRAASAEPRRQVGSVVHQAVQSTSLPQHTEYPTEPRRPLSVAELDAELAKIPRQVSNG